MDQLLKIKLFTLIMVVFDFLIIWNKRVAATESRISISMPNVRPDHAEQYLCLSYRMPRAEKSEYIVSFNPKAEAKRVHHMLLYGCQSTGMFQRDTPNFVWDCSEMHTSQTNSQTQSYEQGPVCRGKEHILYGWALNAPALNLPEGVGFKVGGQETDIHYLVLQVHYGHYHAFSQLPELTDNSGLVLNVKSDEPQSRITKQAGVLLLISYGKVMPGKSRHKMWCDIEENIDIHPFRFRVHTHKLGTLVLGAKLANSREGYEKDNESNSIIGSGDPQRPQMFYPVEDENLVIRKGDTVYAECQFNNNNTHIVNIGQTANDEMCNFYLMYWTNSHKLLSKSNCYSENPKSMSSFFW